MSNNKQKNNNAIKIYSWDLETTNLAANIGFIVCASVRDVYSGQVWTYRIDRTKPFKRGNVWDDAEVVRSLSSKLAEADVWLTHYGSLKKFDLPFLQTRMLVHGIEALPPIPMIDTHTVAKGQLKLHSNRLATLLSILGKDPKTSLDFTIWTKASGGHKPSIQYIVEHCERDVNALAEVYLELRPYIRNHPSVSAILQGQGKSGECPHCGGVDTLSKRGWGYARTTRRQRYYCEACGSWSSGKPEPLGVKAR